MIVLRPVAKFAIVEAGVIPLVSSASEVYAAVAISWRVLSATVAAVYDSLAGRMNSALFKSQVRDCKGDRSVKRGYLSGARLINSSRRDIYLVVGCGGAL